MDPYSNPYIILNNNPYNPFTHSLPSIRELSTDDVSSRTSRTEGIPVEYTRAQTLEATTCR